MEVQRIVEERNMPVLWVQDKGRGRSMIDPTELTPHPKNDQIYGEPDLSDRFVEDIRTNGVTEPLVVTDNSHYTDGRVIVSGRRRQEGAIQAGDEEVPVRTQTFDTPEDELNALLRANDYRDKSFRQKMGEADAIRELIEAQSEDREKNPLQNFAEGETGTTRDKIADRIGIGSGETYRKAKKVWDAAKDGDEEAQELVERINEEEISISWTYTTFTTDDTEEELESEPEEAGVPVDVEVRFPHISDVHEAKWIMSEVLRKNGVSPEEVTIERAEEVAEGEDEEEDDTKLPIN